VTERTALRRLTVAVLAGALSLGCSSSGDDDAAGAGGTGAVAGMGTGGSAAGSTANGGSGALAGGGGTGNGGTAGAGMGNGNTGGVGTGKTGVCGQRGESTVSATAFEGWEEFYLLGDKGFGAEVCIVRIDVTRVGEAPAGCTDCAWSHLVEFSNPTVITDTDGACANSDLGFDTARMDALDGSRAGYGYVFEYMGHNDVLMKNEPGSETWTPFGNAVWNEATDEFHFDSRDGSCKY